MKIKHYNLGDVIYKGPLKALNTSRAVVPNQCSGDHKCSASSLEVLPQIFEIHNILC